MKDAVRKALARRLCSSCIGRRFVHRLPLSLPLRGWAAVSFFGSSRVRNPDHLTGSGLFYYSGVEIEAVDDAYHFAFVGDDDAGGAVVDHLVGGDDLTVL